MYDAFMDAFINLSMKSALWQNLMKWSFNKIIPYLVKLSHENKCVTISYLDKCVKGIFFFV